MKRVLYFMIFITVFGSCRKTEYDLCIYGGTSSGVMAADAAAKMGLDVIIIEPTCRIGGMTTGGLGRTYIGNKQAVRGPGLKFYRELGKRYRCLESWFFEPSVAVEVLTDYHLCGAERNGTEIKSVTVAGRDTISLSAKWSIDASYEGDLLARAGVSYRIGREGNPDGGLLWDISRQVAKPNGTGDNLIQAYNFRVCLTDVPENYDPARFELLLRLFDAATALMTNAQVTITALSMEMT